MARITIILEDDAIGEDPTAVREARMAVKVEITEDEKVAPPSIAMLATHHIRHLWTEGGIPFDDIVVRVNAELARLNKQEASQSDLATAVT